MNSLSTPLLFLTGCYYVLSLEHFPMSSVSPVLPFKMSPSFDVKIAGYADGSEQRTLKLDEVKWAEIPLIYKFLDETDKDTILNFFKARNGKEEPFFWVNPDDGLTYVCRFKDDMVDIAHFIYNLWTYNKVVLVETYWSLI